MRFHSLTDNTSHRLPLHASNAFPYGAPAPLKDNFIDYGPTWDDVPEKFTTPDSDAAKCFCCGGWFPIEDCVINHEEIHKAVPVCNTCADGRIT